ncbi:MAG: endonuclease domain-containing protein [Chloroflexi bacterium]|nr:endonuclease domain-containing protein [Chloroflexota bacterium]
MTDDKQWAGKPSPPELWKLLKPRAREMRKNPTKAESLLWGALRLQKMHGFKFRRQHAFGPYIADFYCAKAKLVIEIDGTSHDGRGEYDEARTQYLESLGLRVLRYSNEDVLQNLQGVVDGIAHVLLGDE